MISKQEKTDQKGSRSAIFRFLFSPTFSGKKQRWWVLGALFSAFVFRLLFGLCSEFWFVDEMQIYLLGLKFYTTGLWPYFGPDVVYTGSQIPGALQALLVGLPFYLFRIPEAPYILLNILSFFSLCLLGWYCTKRIPEIPAWFIWTWVLTAPWTMNYSTHILNTSYVLTGAILFFVGVMETYPFLRRNVIPITWANIMMGFSFFWVFQLHMSWPILIPFLLASLIFQWRERGKKITASAVHFALGALGTGILLVPTFLKHGLTPRAGGVSSNIQFNPNHFLEFFTVLARFLSFVSFELARFLGADTQARVAFLRQNLWVTPFAVFVGIIGLIQPVAMTILWFVKKHSQKDWQAIKYFTLLTVLVVYFSFAFSVKGPASHAFYVVFPVAMIYSFYCWSGFFKSQKWRIFAAVFLAAGIVFHAGLAVWSAPRRSLYKNRSAAVEALQKKDYRILGERRQAFW